MATRTEFKHPARDPFKQANALLSVLKRQHFLSSEKLNLPKLSVTPSPASEDPSYFHRLQLQYQAVGAQRTHDQSPGCWGFGHSSPAFVSLINLLCPVNIRLVKLERRPFHYCYSHNLN